MPPNRMGAAAKDSSIGRDSRDIIMPYALGSKSSNGRVERTTFKTPLDNP